METKKAALCRTFILFPEDDNYLYSPDKFFTCMGGHSTANFQHLNSLFGWEAFFYRSFVTFYKESEIWYTCMFYNPWANQDFQVEHCLLFQITCFF